MKCFLDLDGVLGDFQKQVCKWLELCHNKTLCEWPSGSYDMIQALNLDEKEFWKKINYIDFWSTMPKTEEADLIVEAAVKLVGRKNCYILTSPSLHESSYVGKFLWVGNNYPFLRRRLLIGAFKEVCAGPDKLLIDDSDENINKFRENKGIGILVPRPWNSLHEIATRAWDVVSTGLALLKKEKGL